MGILWPDIAVLAALTDIYGITLDDLVHAKRGGKIGRQREGKAGTGKEQPPDYFMSDRLGGLFDRHAGFCLSEA